MSEIKNKIIIDSDIPFISEPLEAMGDTVYKKGREITKEDIKSANALIVRTRTKCDESLLSGSGVKFIGSATIGFDHIDIPYCESNGIAVNVASGCNAMGVAHYFCGVLEHIKSNKFLLANVPTLGVIGVGNVGSNIAKLGKIMGFKVLLSDPPRGEYDFDFKDTPLQQLLKESDIVTLHVPHTSDTKYATDSFVNEDFFGMMKKGAIFVNSSRGEVVDELALMDAIESKIVSHTYLDVWRNEPNINRELLAKVTIATPHIAGYTEQGKANGTALIVRALANFLGFDEYREWYPKGIKQVRDSRMNGSDILNEVLGYYDITEDDSALRESPEEFEELRNQYDYRQEFFTL